MPAAVVRKSGAAGPQPPSPTAAAYAKALKTCYEGRMKSAAPIDAILERFRVAVNEIYGARLARLVLFGSRARGEAGPDSDYDVAVFLRDMPDRISELNRLADLSGALLEETGEFVHAMPYRADVYNDARMPLMHEIRREGVQL